MAGIIKVNQYQDFNGNTILTSDGSGKLTTQEILYPAFDANLSANQELSNATETKLNFDEEKLDTDNFYDVSTYRFTPLVAGKYFVYASAILTAAANSNLVEANVYIYKNGTGYVEQRVNAQSNPGNAFGCSVSRIIELNGSTDYVEAYGMINTNNSTERVMGTNDRFSAFGAYRIGS
jgi:hypothetical protein